MTYNNAMGTETVEKELRELLPVKVSFQIMCEIETIDP